MQVRQDKSMQTPALTSKLRKMSEKTAAHENRKEKKETGKTITGLVYSARPL
jgi:hypothetical protein